jgi:hypothetical protein
MDLNGGDRWALLYAPSPITVQKPKTELFLALRGFPYPFPLLVYTKELALGDHCLFRIFGRVVPQASNGEWPGRSIQTALGLTHIQGWVLQAWRPNSPLLAQIEWSPDLGGEESIRVIGSSGWKNGDLNAAGRALRFLTNYTNKPGPEKGAGAKFKTADEWHAAIREKVLPKQTRLSAEDWIIASWLDTRPSLLYELMGKWGPKTLADLRNGKF